MSLEVTDNALSTLINSRRIEQNLTYGDIARRGGLPKSTVHKIATTKAWRSAPHPDTLDRLARGLGLPAAVVRKAASESVGLTTHRENIDPQMGLLIGSIEALTPVERAQVAALVDAMVRAHHE